MPLEVDVAPISTLEMASDDSEAISHEEEIGEKKINQISIVLSSHVMLLLAALIVIIGAGISAAFISVGINNISDEQELRFEKQASELVKAVETTWNDYHMVSLWIHEACRSTGDHDHQPSDNNDESYRYNMCSREDFRELYEYVIAGGLEFQAMAFIPNITDQFRPYLEKESSMYYKEFYPDFAVKYLGIVGYALNPNGGTFNMIRRPQQPFYFPQHLIEPVLGNEHMIEFDIYSSPFFYMVDEAVTTFKPIITNPILYPLSPTVDRYVMLFNPGIQVSTSLHQVRSTGLSSVVVRFSELIKRASVGQPESVSIYIFDTTRRTNGTLFGGAHVHVKNEDEYNTTFVIDADLTTLKQSTKNSRMLMEEISIEQQKWTVVVIAPDGTYEGNMTYVILGGVLIFVACIGMALFFYSMMRREKKISEVKDSAKADRAALIVENARKAAQSERELNDYLAHEVRNPLTAAMSSASFLSSTFQEPVSRVDESKQASIREDIGVISSSLEYINDLLRSMLDMHRTTSNQMKLETTHTDVLKDILEPIKTILHQYGNTFDVNIDCPNNLVILTDRMRLKQVVLNLAANSKKFVQKGFIRLRAEVTNGFVELSVEDSGPGIPLDKRSKLFSKFQDSLDSLNQGTGMGLSLCKNLMELMGGEITLDESYDSGVEGYPGVRFVLFLNAPPVQLISIDLDQHEAKLTVPLGEATDHTSDTSRNDSSDGTSTSGTRRELPEKLSVLVVDDDLVLRKLLSRSLKRVAPGWSVQEAANGETALTLVDTEEFDLIFLDQYMAAVEKQLLGTETAHALRAKGVSCKICGLSANNLEEAFLKSGANTFLLKPFRCKKEDLKEDLLRILE